MSELVLGIDTSTRVCVGLARDGVILASRTVGDSRTHVELLMPTVAEVLADHGVGVADLTGIAVGMGPGPYTGLRVGIAAAATMAAVQGIVLRHVCSLDVIGRDYAASSLRADETTKAFIVATDARRKELYWGVYNSDGRRTEGPYVSTPDSLPELPVVGPGSVAYPNAGAGSLSALAMDAGFLAAYAEDLPDVGAEPLYLRHADAVPSVSVKSTLTEKESRR